MPRRLAPSGCRAVGLAALLVMAVALPGAAQEADADPFPSLARRSSPAATRARSSGPPSTSTSGTAGSWDRPGSGPIFTLERADQPGTVLSVTRFDGEVFLDSCDSTSLSSVEASVPRLIEVIAGNPYLNPGPATPVEVDGYAGSSMDAATPAYDECDLPWLLLWALPVEEGGEFVQVADQQSRFIAVDVEGDVVVIAIESFPGVPFGGLLEASLELVDSMRITPLGPAPRPEASPDTDGTETDAPASPAVPSA